MNKLQRLIFFFLFSFFFTECRIIDDSNNPNNKECGALVVWSDDVMDNYSTNERNASYNEFYFENPDTPLNICTDKQAIMTFTIKYPGDTFPYTIQSLHTKIYWGLNNEIRPAMQYDNSKHAIIGKATPDLKSFFGELPAWVGMTVLIRISSTIEDTTALRKIKEIGISAETAITYYEY